MADQSPTADVRAIFWVSGDFDPDDLESVSGVRPTQIRRKGQMVSGVRRPQPASRWSFALQPLEAQSEDMNAPGLQLETLLDSLERGREAIVTYVEDHHLKTLILISIYPSRLWIPVVSLKPALLQRVATMGCELQFSVNQLGAFLDEAHSPT